MKAFFRCGRWKKPLGGFLICLGYLILAGGIAAACFPVALALRIVMPLVGLIAFGFCGFFGAELLDVYLSGSFLQAQREWSAMSHAKRFLWVITLPCRMIVRVVDFFSI